VCVYFMISDPKRLGLGLGLGLLELEIEIHVCDLNHCIMVTGHKTVTPKTRKTL